MSNHQEGRNGTPRGGDDKNGLLDPGGRARKFATPLTLDTTRARNLYSNALVPTGTVTSPLSSTVFTPSTDNGMKYGTPTSRRFSPATALYPSSVWSPIEPNDTAQSATSSLKPLWGTPPKYAQAHQPSSARMPQIRQPTSATGFDLDLKFGEVGLDGFLSKDFSDVSRQGHMRSNAHQNYPSQSRYQVQQVDLAETNLSSSESQRGAQRAQHPFGVLPESVNHPRIQLNGKAATVPELFDLGYDSQFNGVLVKNRKDSTTGDAPDEDTSSVASNPFGLEYPNGLRFLRKFEQDRSPVSHGPPSELTAPPVQLPREAEGEILFEEADGLSWKKQFRDKDTDLEEYFPGAITTLETLRRESFFLDSTTRVVSIKTDFLDNVTWSIKNGNWVAMEAVGERIMRLWEARDQHKTEQVLFLFSVNGQKSYCGLATMTGPWTQGTITSTWKDKNMAGKTMGYIPITWMIVKNAPFVWFEKIRHLHNGGPIYNMWNGMHFPQESGHKVLKIYVTKPHYTNVLCWPKDKPYRPSMQVTHPSELAFDIAPPSSLRAMQRAPTMNVHNDFQLARRANSHRLQPERGQAAASRDWRHSPQHASPAHNERANVMSNNHRGQRESTQGHAEDANNQDPTPVAKNRRGIMNRNMGSTSLNVDTNVPSHPAELATVPCILDSKGNYVPVTPHRPQFSTTSSPSQQSANFQTSPGSSRGYCGGRRGGDNAPMHAQDHRVGQPRFQRSPNSSISPTIHRMRSEAAFTVSPNSPRNLRHAQTMMNMRGQQQNVRQTPAADKSGRSQQAASNVNVPSRTVSIHSQQASSYKATGRNTSQYASGVQRSTPSSQNLYDMTPQELGMPSPSAQNSPSYFSQLSELYSPVSSSQGFTTPDGQPIYPTPTDRQDVERPFTINAEAEAFLQRLRDEENAAAARLNQIRFAVQTMQHKASWTGGTRGSFSATSTGEHDSIPDWASSSTYERRNISPLYGSDGHIIDSSSKHGSPAEKAARTEANRQERYLRYGVDRHGFGARERDNVARIVDSPEPIPEEDEDDGKEEILIGCDISLAGIGNNEGGVSIG